MALTVHLLGSPRITRGGEAVPGPRGYKAWGLLAYLLLVDSPPSRSHLAGLLFAEADDPLAALRWNLSALRRLLADAELEGDPLRVSLPAGTLVDVAALTSGAAVDSIALADVERELLEGMVFRSSPAFEIWLETERRHMGAAAEAILREAALARLGEGDAGVAADLAGRLVALNPYDENFQTLLVRSLSAAGDGVGAARQVVRCTELFRRDLGSEPSPALAAAAQTVTAAPTTGPMAGAAGARAQLEAGEAATRAGALEAGLQCLRRAVVDARSAGDQRLQAQALVALGYALVHAARGRDEEASAALHEALTIAEARGWRCARRLPVASWASSSSCRVATTARRAGCAARRSSRPTMSPSRAGSRARSVRSSPTPRSTARQSSGWATPSPSVAAPATAVKSPTRCRCSAARTCCATTSTLPRPFSRNRFKQRAARTGPR